MTNIGSWDPNQEKENADKPIDRQALTKFISLSESALLDTLNQQLTPEEIEQHRYLMKRHKDEWASIAENFSNEQLIHLVRFFTLAEAQLAGWEAGSLSPVIWLCRALKKRGAFPDHDLIQWIKDNTDNKFLPYGNILDI